MFCHKYGTELPDDASSDSNGRHENRSFLGLTKWNTKRFAEAISGSLKVPHFDIITFALALAADFDLLIIGTPAKWL